MKRFCLTTVFGGLIILGVCAESQAAITCATSDYRGTYAFTSTGYLLQLPPEGAPLLGPFAQSGTFTADGQGNVTIESQAAYNGLILPGPAQTTYTISPDCVVTYNLTLPLPLAVPSVFTGFLSTQNREATVTITDPQGTMVIGRHVKQDMSFCSVADFTGSYKVDMDGAIASPASRAGRFFRLGRLVADGNGNFTMASIANYNGRQQREDLAGTYDLNSRCYLTLRYINRTGTATENIAIGGSLAGHGEIGMMMVLSPGWTVSGTIKAQQ